MSEHKWALYAEAHEKYRREYTGLCRDPGDTDLYRRGWDEIAVCDTPSNLESLFTPELTAMVVDFFQSHFAVLFASEMVRHLGEMDETCGWHYDAAPEAHLRIMAPLVESDGGTAIIDLEESQALDYCPQTIRDRKFDHAEFGASGRWEVKPSVGQALIFQPSRVLHKSIPPKTLERRVYQLGLVPWGEPWQVFEAEHGKNLRENANSFPDYQKERVDEG